MVNKTLNIRQFERPFSEKTRLVERQDIIHIAILTAIAFVIGVYLIATTVLIAKDGTYYIESAKSIADNPVEAMRNIPSWGYPFLIYIAHRIVTLISNSVSVETWIYSAQSVSLLCRMLSLIPLYFIGKLLVGSRNSYLALLVLIFLPYPAEYGSEIVREWPHLFFLATALLFLIYGSIRGNWGMFAIAGLFTGLGHMIRPECAQIVIYAILWLVVGLFIPRIGINKLKAICLTLILIIGFLIPVVPYFKINGEILPPKLKELISCNTPRQLSELEQTSFSPNGGVCTASVMPNNILKALGKLAERISENLMYFFVLPLIIGLYYHFRRPKEALTDARLFISALIILYAAMMLLLHINYGYISRRHCMPMIVFTAFYIPTGLVTIADWISGTNKIGNENRQKSTQNWFFILLAAGILICLVKLSGLISEKNQGYKDAAKWLMANTAPADIIAVPDERIAFYAERKGLEYDEKIPEQANYVVKIVRSEDEKLVFGKEIKEEYSTWVDNKKSRKLVIYRLTR